MSVNSTRDTHICQSGWYFHTKGQQREKNVKTSIYKTLSQASLSHITFEKRDTFIYLSAGIRLLQQQFSPRVISGGVFRSDKVSLNLH